MRWSVLLMSILSFNSYSGIWGNVKESAQDPFSSILIPFYLSSVAICSPLALSTDTACQYLGVNILKKVVHAKPDAATYLASNGEIKAAYLDQALTLLRKEYPNASDMELAKAILAY